MPLPGEWVQQYNNNLQQTFDVSDEQLQAMENQRIMEEQDRLWQEALDNIREADRQRGREHDPGMRVQGNFSGNMSFNVTVGEIFRIPPGTHSIDSAAVASFFNSTPKPTKPRRRVVSPIFLGPAWVDQ